MTYRLDSLTALRFVAALGVVLCHLAGSLPAAVGEVTTYFQVGVDFFFVLSGFVLAWSWKPSRSTARFYWLRFARIWPLHLITMLAGIALFGVANPISLVLHPILLQSWYPAFSVTYGLNGVAWTLSVEVLFYALFPFLMPVLDRWRTRQLWGMAVVSVTVMWVFPALVRAVPLDPRVQWWVTSILPVARLPQFVLGVCIALLLMRRAVPRIPLWVPSIAGVALFALAPIADLEVWQVGALVTAVAASAIVALAQAEPTWSRPVPRALVTLGEWSFALYLTHSLLLEVLHDLGLQGWGLVAVTVPASIALSGAAYLWWERPVERWLRARPVGLRRQENPAG